MNRRQNGMYGDGDGREVEVVEQHRQVVVQAPCGMEVQAEDPARDALDGNAATVGVAVGLLDDSGGGGRGARAHDAMLSVPELDMKLKIGFLEGFLDLKMGYEKETNSRF